jgi:hypothetical protein
VLEPLCTLARSEDIEVEIQRFSVLAIANLASHPDNHAAFIENGMLPFLISLSNANDAEVRGAGRGLRRRRTSKSGIVTHDEAGENDGG